MAWSGTAPFPYRLLSGGKGVSWEWLTEVCPHRSWRYEAVGKPLWSKATGFTRLEDRGEGRTRVHFEERYHAFNPILRRLFERRVHEAISRSNDDTIASSITAGVRGHAPARTQSREDDHARVTDGEGWAWWN